MVMRLPEDIPQQKSQLVAGGYSNPVLEFSGRLDSYEIVDASFTGDDGKTRTRQRMVLKHLDCDIIEVAEGEVWPYPQVDVSLVFTPGAKEREDSGTGKTIAAVDKLQAGAGLNDLFGRVVHWKQHRDDRSFKNRRTGEQVEFIVVWWELLEAEGLGAAPTMAQGGANLYQVALDLMHGHSDQEFRDLALKDARLRSDGSIITEIVQGKLQERMKLMGYVAHEPHFDLDDGGMYTKVKDVA